MTKDRRISRRAALARLGLGVAGAYVAPAFVGLSQARASGASGSSGSSSASPASSPSPASTPSSPSTPGVDGTSQPSGPSGPGGCRGSSFSGEVQISQRDYKRAQRAIARGEARPLREVLDAVRAEHPGRVLQVGYSDKGGPPMFQVLIVDPSGAVKSITVDAGSGLVTNMWKC